jgi:hypothetical protein
VLLAWAGVGKLARPPATQAAARAIGLPSAAPVVRAFGAAEVAIAAAGVLFGGIAAVAVAAVYLLLASVAYRLLRVAPATPCGCLGGGTAPATRAHVVIDLAAAAVALLAAFGPAVVAELGEQPFAGVPFVVLAVCAARLAGLLMDRPGLMERPVMEEVK